MTKLRIGDCGLRIPFAGAAPRRKVRRPNPQSAICNPQFPIARRHARRAIILPVILVIVGLLALLMAGFIFFVRAEASGMAAFNEGQQAQLAAQSGLEEIVSVLRTDRDNPKAWFDNPDRLHNVLIWSDIYTRDNDPVRAAGSRTKYFQSNPDRRTAWRYSVVAARYDGPAKTIRYGIMPEGGKLDLNVATEKQLVELLTPLLNDLGVQNPQDLINCILDWRDTDDEVREGGAENEYYHTLKPAYNCKNGAFDTLEELLLVKGITPAILYGEDVNRNGLLDTNENDGDASFPVYDNADGVLNHGIAPFLTVLERDFDRSADNKQKINLNADAALITAQAAKTLAEGELSDTALQYILSLKQQGFNFGQMKSAAELYGPVGSAVTAEEQAAAEQQQEQQQDQQGQPGQQNQQGQQGRQGAQGQQQNGGKQDSGQNGGGSQNDGASGKSGGQSRVKAANMQTKAPPGGSGGKAPPGNNGGAGGKPPTNPGGSDMPGGVGAKPPGSGGGGAQGGQSGGRGGNNGGGNNGGGQAGGGRNPRGGGTGSDGSSDAGSGEDTGGGQSGGPPLTPGGSQGRGGRGGGGRQQMTVAQAVANSPITPEDLPVLMDRFSVRPAQQANAPLTGLININAAPGRVLMLVPGMTEEAASAILTTREKLDAPALKTIAWPLVYAGVDPAVYKAIAPYITVRAYQFHVEVLGYADHLKIAKRVEWIIEMVGPLAQIKYTRDLTALGFAWPVDDDTVTAQGQ